MNKFGKNKWFLLLITLTFILILVACNAVEDPAEDTELPKHLLFGVGDGTTAHGILDLSKTALFDEALEEYDITTIEVGGYDSVIRLAAGETIGGPAITNAIFEAWRGDDPFDEPFEDIRMLAYHNQNIINFVAREGAGIENIRDLDGADYGPVARGYATERASDEIMEVLGIKPNYYRGDGGDIKDAFLDRRIDAACKAGVPPEPMISEWSLSFKLKFLEFSEEDMEKVLKEVPYLVPRSVPLDAYGMEGQTHETVMMMRGTAISTKVPQDVGYRMAKAVMEPEGTAHIKSAFTVLLAPLAEQTIETVKAAAEHPYLHAGTVQYLEEMGYEVPAHVIPPEYERK